MLDNGVHIPTWGVSFVINLVSVHDTEHLTVGNVAFHEIERMFVSCFDFLCFRKLDRF